MRAHLAILGPTAAGKTGLACALARRFPLRLISVDSAQVYRGLDIGSAKPSPAERARFPHRLVDIREPWEAYSAADFVRDAKREIEAAHQAGDLPVLVGGTMLYYRALTRGLSALPSGDPAMREALDAEAQRVGWPGLHARLAAVDPVAAARLAPNDAQRIQRALEVFFLTGRPISELQQAAGRRVAAPALKFVVCPADRKVLHARIAERLDRMFANGLVEEVEALRADPRVNETLPALRSVGYRQVWRYLEGDYDLDEAKRRALYATRQLAKRQITWLRKEGQACWLDPCADDLVEQAARRLSAFVAEQS